jgi:hypothetical protein
MRFNNMTLAFPVFLLLIFIVSGGTYAIENPKKGIQKSSNSGNTWQYRETTKGIEKLFTIEVVQETDKMMRLVERSSTTTHEYHLNKKDGSILTWKMKKNGTAMKAIRTANTIKLCIEKNGKKRTETKELGKTPWIQSMEVGLQWFVNNKKKTIQEFWIIRPTDGSIEKLVAKKKIEEKIKIREREYNTIQVEVTVPGWRSMFWGVDYWYKKDNGVFVKYKGADGPPGTPETVTELVQ